MASPLLLLPFAGDIFKMVHGYEMTRVAVKLRRHVGCSEQTALSLSDHCEAVSLDFTIWTYEFTVITINVNMYEAAVKNHFGY